MTAALKLEAVSAAYGPTRVLDDLSLEVPAGSLTALLGPSGCGKTTLLRVVAGLVRPTTGDVWLGAERLTDVAAEQRGIGVVFQKPLLFPHLSVADNVAFGLSIRGVPPAAIREEVNAALAMVQLDGFGHRRPRELSGGQEQRVALARAIVTRPRVLLLDEPLTALDQHLRDEMRAFILSLQRRLAITTVFVTHDQHEADFMADQVALVLEGRIAQCGVPRDFYTAPRTAAVARFFGWCVLHGTAAGGRVHLAGGSLGAPPELQSGATPTLVGFHPSAAVICDPDVPCPDDGLPATIEHVLDRGFEARVSLRLASGDRIEVLRTGTNAARVGGPGSSVRVRVPASAIACFP